MMRNTPMVPGLQAKLLPLFMEEGQIKKRQVVTDPWVPWLW